ncbi:hypothetical protein HUJ05_008823 [Dendroctonus ponderosae]|nr:hypothetical protein HUJ05_008823 [Dendroctonus ponderosae]
MEKPLDSEVFALTSDLKRHSISSFTTSAPLMPNIDFIDSDVSFSLILTVNNVFKVFEHFGLPIQVSDQEATLICVAFYRLKAFNDDQTRT